MTFAVPLISGTTTRLLLLTLASALLLAAGDATTSSTDRLANPTADNILAPMTPAEASAARAALAASLPPEAASTADTAPDAAFNAAPDVASQPTKSLSQLVSRLATATAVDAELRCLATAVYFESRGEPLEGQLAVAQAIINRTESGRYASSICGVINQPGQFSFNRSRSPAPGNDWRTAQAIAQIAVDDMWRDVAPRANSFHAARLAPGWRDKVRVAQIGNHIFYR